MSHCLDHIQILCSGSLGIFNDLISFLEESIKNKIPRLMEIILKKIATR